MLVLIWWEKTNIKKNTDTLIGASEEVGLETNTEKTMYMNLKQVGCMEYMNSNEVLQEQI
jgi:hypothetical protein